MQAPGALLLEGNLLSTFVQQCAALFEFTETQATPCQSWPVADLEQYVVQTPPLPASGSNTLYQDEKVGEVEELVK